MRATVIAQQTQPTQQQQHMSNAAAMQQAFASMGGGAAHATGSAGHSAAQTLQTAGVQHAQPLNVQQPMMYSYAPQGSFMPSQQPMLSHAAPLRPQAQQQQTSPVYPFSYGAPSSNNGGGLSPTSLVMPPNPFANQSSYMFNPSQPQLSPSASLAPSMQFHPTGASYVMQPQPPSFNNQQGQSIMQHPQQPAPIRFQPAPHSIYSSMASMNVSGPAQTSQQQSMMQQQPQMQHIIGGGQFGSQLMQPTSAQQQHQALVQQHHQQNQLLQHQFAQHQLNMQQQQQHQLQQHQLFNMQSKVKSEQGQLSPSQMMMQESPMSTVPMYPMAVRAVSHPQSPAQYTTPNSMVSLSPNGMRGMVPLPALGANVMHAPGVMHPMPILNAKTVVRATLVAPIHTGALALSQHTQGGSAPQSAQAPTSKKLRRSSASTARSTATTTQHSPMLPASTTASQWSSEADDDDARSPDIQSSDEQHEDESDPEHSMSEEEPDSGDEYDDDGDAPARKPRRDGSRPPLMRKSSARAGESVPADQQSIIVCGVASSTEPGAPRRFMEDSKYFGAHVDVYTALDDPKQRTLFRASALAHKFHVATNQVGMYLVRRRHQGHVQGLYQATAFQSKPAGRTGLKAGGYFVSMDLCLQFENYMAQHSKHNRYRARGLVRQSGRRGPAPLASEPYHPRPSQHKASQRAKAAKAAAAAAQGMATASSSAASSVSAHSPVPGQRSVKVAPDAGVTSAATAAQQDLARVLVDCALVMERRASH